MSDTTDHRKRPASTADPSESEGQPSARAAVKRKHQKEEASNNGKDGKSNVDRVLDANDPSTCEKIDICQQLGLKAGDRLEVLCDDMPADSEEQSDEVAASATTASTSSDGNKEDDMVENKHRWVLATILPFEGSYHTFEDDEDDSNKHEGQNPRVEHSEKVSVAIHSLKFHPIPEEGLPEDVVEVCFITSNTLVYLDLAEDGLDGNFHWRKEGNRWEPSLSTLAGIPTFEEFMSTEDDCSTMSTLEKKLGGDVWEGLTEKLVDKLEDEGKVEPSPQDWAQLLRDFRRGLEERVAAINSRNPYIDSKGDVQLFYETEAEAREQVRTILDGVLATTLAKESLISIRKKTPAAAQAYAAERIARSKELMVDKIVSLLMGSDTLTEAMMLSVMQEVMQTMST